MSDCNFFGGWCSTSAVRGPWPETCRPRPVDLCAASSSAALMKGRIRDWTEVRSYSERKSVLASHKPSIAWDHAVAPYILHLVRPIETRLLR